MQDHRQDLPIVDKDSLDNLAQQLFPCFKRILDVLTLVPIGTEIRDEVRCFNQLVVVDRPQRVNLPFKLLPPLDILILRNETLVPPKIYALDNGVDFFHTMERSLILDTTPYC